MKKTLLIIVLLSFFTINAQFRGPRQRADLIRTETYVTNSPGNSASTSWLTGFDKDSTAIAWGYPSVQFWKHKSSRNDGTPTSIAWFDSDGYLKRSPIPAWITAESDPKWTMEKGNYYDKTTSDARYLQSFLESDPIWNAEKTNYRTKSQNDLLYEALFAKNSAFNRNFGTASNTVAEGNDGRILNGAIAFTWGNHAGLYVILSGSYSNPTWLADFSFTKITGKPTTISGYGITDAVNVSRTLIINGVSQDLSLNRTWSVGDLLSTATYNNPTWLNTLAYSKLTGAPIQDYTNSGVVAGGAGNVVFYLTSDKTSTGTALYTNVNYVNPIVNDSAVNYTYGWSYNAGTKALTVNVKSATGLYISLLNLTLLGTPANVANGVNVSVLVKGN